MSSVAKHVVLTGEPGVGKTTIIKNVCDSVRSQGKHVVGFYTSERRLNGERTGFDIVTMDGRSASLATVDTGQQGSSTRGKPRVGRYLVDIKEFENLALPSLDHSNEIGENPKVLLVVDEIGKMELFSKRFETRIKELFLNPDRFTILATIPVPKRHTINLVEEIRSSGDIKLFEITRANRNSIHAEVLQAVNMIR